MRLAVVLAGLLAFAVPAAATIAPDLSRPGAGGPPTEVRVTLFLADMDVVQGAEQSFGGDVVMIAEWTDPRLAFEGTGTRGADLTDVWNPRLQLVNQRVVFSYLPPRVEIFPSGLVRLRQRWIGKFSSRMDLRDFPLDRQDFKVELVSLGYPRSEVALIPSPTAPKSCRSTVLTQTDWKMGPAMMKVHDFEASPGAPNLAGVELEMEGRRYVRYYLIQVVLPLVLIVLMGWTAIWIDASVVTTRMSVVVTTMLTLIAYRFALGHLVPNLTYLTRFDYFTLGATLLIFLMLLIVAASAYLFSKGRKEAVGTIDRTTRWALPVLFAALCFFVGRS